MVFGIKTKIINFIETKIFPRTPLKSIRISPVGYACTNSCSMCWRSAYKVDRRIGLKKSELKLNDYIKLLNSLPRSVRNIEVVGGGEPLLYPDIKKLLIEIKRRNFFGSLITNGVMLDNKIINILNQVKWNFVQISLNAGSKDVYTNTSGTNNFNFVIKNIRKLVSSRKKHNTKVDLHYVIQKSNYKDIDNFIKLAKKLKVDSISFNTLIYDTSFKCKLSKRENEILKSYFKRVIKKIKIKNNIAEIINMLDQGTIRRKKSYYKGKYCQISQYNLDIGSEGAVVPCCMAYGEGVGLNLKKNNINNIWLYLAPLRKKLRKGEFENFCYQKCNYCLYKNNNI